MAEIRRIAIQSQPGQILCKTLSRKVQHKIFWWSGSSVRGPDYNARGPELKP
jgi:hypothetical protein